ncbi:MAG: class I SAM-dependent methyltransferase [Egibacteraceae bacterium]
MAATQTVQANEEAIEAWDGVLFDRFVRFREIATAELGRHGEEALRLHPPQAGERVLDLGCGFGDTTQRLGELVGSTGLAVGIDAAPRFIEVARAEAASTGAANVRFTVGDVQGQAFEERFDRAFSRFGTMFFANPVAALRNVRSSLCPGGSLCMVVWRRKVDNPWLHRAEKVVKALLPEAAQTDEPTCGPGPVSMADADTTSEILVHAGFEEISLHRCDMPIRIGADIEEAIACVTALGPAGEAIRLAGAEAERIRPRIETALRHALSEVAGPDGVRDRASTWIVAARVPTDAG